MNNLRRVLFGSARSNRVSGYVKEHKPGKWVVRVVITSAETGRRKTVNQVVKGSREYADSVLETALRRAKDGYDLCRVTSEQGGFSPTGKMKTGGTGALSELLTASVLLQRGYDVYRSVAATGACDLIALDPDTNLLCRVEVKTSSSEDKSPRPFKEGESKRFDVLALVVLRRGIVKFQPSIEDWFEGQETPVLEAHASEIRLEA